METLRNPATFRHEALLYAGLDEFVREMSAFILDGLAEREPVLVVVIPPKIDLLREALGDRADGVRFADMSEIGRNPSRIIPVWRDFVGTYANGKPIRGIGEPIWSGRTEDEIVESQRHESLINLAFNGAPAWILCPYDIAGLDPSVVDESFRSHPTVTVGGRNTMSGSYRGLDEIARPFDIPLSEPEHPQVRLPVEPGELESIRRFVAGYARDSGLSRFRVHDFVLAVNELTTNTLRHSGGLGTFRIWRETDSVVAEVSDGGRIEQPLAGRQAPSSDRENGMGLWIVNQLCDLVQVRVFEDRSVVRIHMTRR
ncbi:MAG: anti-sigma factor RsbA family regulatory protein [Actinomycetota bacterium]